MSHTIRPFIPQDHDQWLPLWQGYLDFYQSTLPENTTEHTWQSLLNHPAMQGIGAYDDVGNMLGFTHIIIHPYTWNERECVYLEDLYVAPSARRQGIARALIEAVYHYAQAHSYPRVYWLTAESNHDAQQLYHQVARHTGMIQFRKDFSST